MATTLPEIKRRTPTPPPEEEPDTSAAALAALRERLPPIRPPSPLVRRHRPAPPVVSAVTLNARAPRSVPLPVSSTALLKRLEKDENNARATIAADEQLQWTHTSIEWLRAVCNEREGTVVIRETSRRDTITREEEREWTLLYQEFTIAGTRLSQRIMQSCARQMQLLGIEMLEARKEEQVLEANERTVLRRRELIYRPVPSSLTNEGNGVVAVSGKLGFKSTPAESPQQGSPTKSSLVTRVPNRPPSADRNFAENGRKRWGDEKQYREALIRYDTAVMSLDPREQFRREEVLGLEMTAWLKIQRDVLKDRHRIERSLTARGAIQNAQRNLNDEEYLIDEAHNAAAEAVVGHVLSCALVVSGQEQEKKSAATATTTKQQQQPHGQTEKRRTSDVTLDVSATANNQPSRRQQQQSPLLPLPSPHVANVSGSMSSIDILLAVSARSPNGVASKDGLEVLAAANAKSSRSSPAQAAKQSAEAGKPTVAKDVAASKGAVAAQPQTAPLKPRPPSGPPASASGSAPVVPQSHASSSEHHHVAPSDGAFPFPTLNILCDILLDERQADPTVVSRWQPLLEAAVELTGEQVTKQHPKPFINGEYFYRMITCGSTSATRDFIENVVWRTDRHHHGVQFAIELIPTRWSSYQSKEELEEEELLEMVYREMLTREKLVEEQLEELWNLVDGARAVAVAKPSPKKVKAAGTH